MAARARAGDAELLRINAPLRGIGADEAHGPMNVLGDLGDGELGLRSVHDGENCVAAVKEGFVVGGIDRFLGGEPATTDHVNHRAPVRLRSLEDVERQGDAELPPVDDVLGALEAGVLRGGSGDGEAKCEQREHGAK